MQRFAETFKVFGLYLLSRGLALLPVRLLWVLCQVLGLAYYGLSAKRRRLIASNWHHAFPQKQKKWILAQARHSCMHLVELGLMGVVWPFWSEATLRKRFRLTARSRELIQEVVRNPAPRIILVPHFSLTESLALIPWLFGENLNIGVLYRPLNQPSIEAFVKKTRERFGLRLLPRSRNGMKEALAFLQQGNSLVVLFDQSPREAGWLGAFMGRLATSTPLPGRLFERYNALAYTCYARSLGPFRAEICIERLQASGAEELIERSNFWLEGLLRSDLRQACTWLWAHNRWRFLEQQHLCLALPSKIQKMPFTEELKSFRLWIVLPSINEELQAFLPTLESIVEARPDLDLELYVQAGQAFEFQGPVGSIPQELKAQQVFFKKQADRYPDAILLCTPAGPLDASVAASQAPVRLSYAYPGAPRADLTHTWQVPEGCGPKNPLFWKSLHAAFSPA